MYVCIDGAEVCFVGGNDLKKMQFNTISIFFYRLRIFLKRKYTRYYFT